MEDVLDIDVRPLYKEVLQKLIPFHKWYSWLDSRMKSVTFVSKKTNIKPSSVSDQDQKSNLEQIESIPENPENQKGSPPSKKKKKGLKLPFL